jgi:hypothetical protein
MPRRRPYRPSFGHDDQKRLIEAMREVRNLADSNLCVVRRSIVATEGQALSISCSKRGNWEARAQIAKRDGSTNERVGKARNYPNKTSLATGRSLLKQATEMRLHCALGNAQGLRDLRDAADLDDGQ